MNLDLAQVPTPCYVCDEAALQRNCELLARVQQESGGRIILALKGFAMFSVFPLVHRYLVGTTASSLNEARLGAEEFGGEVHVYAPAYTDAEMPDLLALAHHITFNSFSQWRRFRALVAATDGRVQAAVRINPEHSEVKTKLYDPCAPGSRLGVTLAEFREEDMAGLTGLHFHTLCELNADALERTLAAVEAKFGRFLSRVQWVNFGGGHHITRPDYDVARLIHLIRDFRTRHNVAVYLEPGEAIALNTGVLVTSVLDLVRNSGVDIAILDTSATAHMPDVIEMPYRPQIVGADLPGKLPHTYRLGGLTCLAGDVIGDYSFPRPLAIGDKLVFLDMAHYTMVKNTTFNGVPLPAIAVANTATGAFRVVRRFGYPDYRNRLS